MLSCLQGVSGKDGDLGAAGAKGDKVRRMLVFSHDFKNPRSSFELALIFMISSSQAFV